MAGRLLTVVDGCARSMDEKSEAIGRAPSEELDSCVVVAAPIFADGCVVVTETLGSNRKSGYREKLD